MKEFMLIFIGANYAEMNFSPEQIQAKAQKWMSWQEKMSKQGILNGGNALQPDMRRVSGPDRTITDRSSTELKELVGGYYLIKVKDYDAAIEVAKDYPDYDEGGTVEIREIMYYN